MAATSTTDCHGLRLTRTCIECMGGRHKDSGFSRTATLRCDAVSVSHVEWEARDRSVDR